MRAHQSASAPETLEREPVPIGHSLSTVEALLDVSRSLDFDEYLSFRLTELAAAAQGRDTESLWQFDEELWAVPTDSKIEVTLLPGARGKMVELAGETRRYEYTMGPQDSHYAFKANYDNEAVYEDGKARIILSTITYRLGEVEKSDLALKFWSRARNQETEVTYVPLQFDAMGRPLFSIMVTPPGADTPAAPIADTPAHQSPDAYQPLQSTSF